MPLRSRVMSDQEVEDALVFGAGEFSSKRGSHPGTDIKQPENFLFNKSHMSAQTQASNMPLKVISSSLFLVC